MVLIDDTEVEEDKTSEARTRKVRQEFLQGLQLSYLDAASSQAKEMIVLFSASDSFEEVLAFTAKLKSIAQKNANFSAVIARSTEHSVLGRGYGKSLLELRFYRSTAYTAVRELFSGIAGFRKQYL